MGGVGPDTLFFSTCGHGVGNIVGGKKKYKTKQKQKRRDREMNPSLHGPPLSGNSTSSAKLPHPKHSPSPSPNSPHQISHSPLHAPPYHFLHPFVAPVTSGGRCYRQWIASCLSRRVIWGDAKQISSMVQYFVLIHCFWATIKSCMIRQPDVKFTILNA